RRPLGRVVHFAIGGMTGAGVVPGFRAFEATILKRFEHRDGKRGFEFFQKDPKRGAHNAGADEDNVRFVNEGIWHRISLSNLLVGQFASRVAWIRPSLAAACERETAPGLPVEGPRTRGARKN